MVDLDRTKVAFLYHHACTAILPSVSADRLPPGSPKWTTERTHGCWCSGWKMTTRGIRVRRNGRWAVPGPTEVRKKTVERWQLAEGAIEVSHG